MRKQGKIWIARMLFFKLIFFALLTFVVMFLWNQVVVDLFALKRIGFLQALGLLLLTRILTGHMGPRSFNHRNNLSHGKGMMRQHWKSMSEEYKKQWMDKMRKGEWPIKKEDQP